MTKKAGRDVNNPETAGDRESSAGDEQEDSKKKRSAAVEAADADAQHDEDSSDEDETLTGGGKQPEGDDEEEEDEGSEEADEGEDEADDAGEDEEAGDRDGERTPPKSVPYARFKQVNSQLKTTRGELAEVRSRLDQLTERLGEREDGKKEKTWDDLNVDELKRARQHYREKGDDNMVDFISDKIAERLADQRAETRLSERERKAIKEQSWAEVLRDYPELQNTDSALYQRTKQLIQRDRRFSDPQFPEGFAVAARLAAEQLLRERALANRKKDRLLSKKVRDSQRREGLEAKGRGGGAPKTSLDKLEEEAVNSGDPYSPAWRRLLKATSQRASRG